MKRALILGGFAAVMMVAAALAQQKFNTIGGYGNPTPRYPQPTTGNSSIPTYSASANFSNSSAGDAFCIYGSATLTVNVKMVRVTATASAQVVSNISLVRRSSLDTGGGLTAMTAVPSDATNSAATASAMYFTSAPSAGTLVGNIRDRFLTISATATNVVSVSEGQFHFSPFWDQPQTLRGATDGLCVKVPSTAGGSWSISAEWTEDSN